MFCFYFTTLYLFLGVVSTKSNVNKQTTAAIAKELLNAGTSPTADAIAATQTTKQSPVKKVTPSNVSSSSSSPTKTNTVTVKTVTPTTHSSLSSETIRPKDQLLYLGSLLGFQVNKFTISFKLFTKYYFCAGSIFRFSKR